MSDDQEQVKSKLWKTYGIILGIMVGGPLIIFTLQGLWNNFSKSNTAPIMVESSPPSSSIPNSGNALSTSEASSIIAQWLEAKKSFFGPSHTKNIGEKMAIGLAYERNITAKPGDELSSVDELAKEGTYYTYSNQQVHQIDNIQTINPTEVLIVAIVSEQRTLHRKGNTKNSSSNRSKSCYQLTKVDNSWKISKTPELFKSCP
jgi:ARC6-like, IMS domain